MKFNIQTFIILPLNDNELLAQARAEFSDIVPFHHIMGAQSVQCTKYLKNMMTRYPDLPKLIIVDESHVGVEKGSALDMMFKEASIQMSGELADDVYMLTISATPNAEAALLSYKEIKAKKDIVVLEPSSSYYGVSAMLEDNKLRMGWKLDDDGIEKLVEMCEEFTSINKYMIIRCNDKGKIDTVRDYLKDIYGNNIKVIDYSSRNTTKDINSIIKTAPPKPTIILLAQRLKASKQLITDNISMCFEYGGSFYVSLQGLLGRNCGHHKRANGVIIYCNIDHVILYERWCTSLYDPFGTPNDNHYVTEGSTSSNMRTSMWKKNIPVSLELSNEIKDRIVSMETRYKYGQLHYDLKALWEEQYQRLSITHPGPIKGNGVMIISSDETISAKSTYKDWWLGPSAAGTKRTKMIGFDTSSSSLPCEKKSGYFMYINKETLECWVCYSSRLNKPHNEPIIKDNCAYKPKGILTRREALIKLKARLRHPQKIIPNNDPN